MFNLAKIKIMNIKFILKKLTGVFIILLFFLISYILLNSLIDSNKSSSLISVLKPSQKEFIVKYIFPYRLISKQEEKIFYQNKEIKKLQRKFFDLQKRYTESQLKYLNEELNFKESGLETMILKNVNISENLLLEYYPLEGGFDYGINKASKSGSGFIDFHKNNLFILSSTGVLIYAENFTNQNYLLQIKNNINNFIGKEQFSKNQWFSIKDMHIFNNKIYISYTEEIKKNCWNTSIIYGNINYNYIDFKKFFSPSKCISSIDNIDKEFNAHQSGGRIINFDDDNFLFSIGEYRSRYLAQDKKSVNGKIIKIDIKSKDYKIFSMGHRNPQGLYFDKQNNIVLETEHGPKGGDEINVIEIDEEKILNYGWPIASYGEHYNRKNKAVYQKYPLYKSHKQFGFIEPLKSFVPSIGISEITKIADNKYVFGSMVGKSIFFFDLDNIKKINNLKKIDVFERVRDLKFKNNKLYLFLENTSSIGVIDLVNFLEQ